MDPPPKPTFTHFLPNLGVRVMGVPTSSLRGGDEHPQPHPLGVGLLGEGRVNLRREGAGGE